MTAETSNARGEWVLVPRELAQGMRSALARAVNASCNTDEWYAHTLAAAPQPPSAPVVPDWITGDGLQGIKAEAHFLTQHKDETAQRVGRRLIERADKIIAALAQQPAAVDEAYHTPRNRAEAVALARLALAHLGVIDAHIDAAIARCETNSATQRQEPKS